MDKILLDLLKGKWTPYDPPPFADELAEMMDVLPVAMPNALLELYRHCNGAHFVSDHYLADDEEFVWFNTEEDWREEFPHAIFFALDEGSGVYFLDMQNQLGHGAGSVYWCDRAAMMPEVCLLYGDGVEGFLHNIVAGIEPRSWSYQDRQTLQEHGHSFLNVNR